jgi:hypothetical protein
MALDSLPRTDPFWTNTNNKTTMFKLGGYYEQKLTANPNDAATAWICLAYNLCCVGEPIDIRYWRPLLGAGEANCESLVRIAANMSAYWTDENVHSLATLIKALRQVESCRPVLQMLMAEGEDWRDWAREVIARI